jgi:DoxX-like family
MSTIAASASTDVPATPTRGRRYWIRTIAFWFVTLNLAFEMVAGSIWDLLQIEYVRGVMTHLGYPHYILIIIGVCKFPCAVAVMVPRFPRLKEWPTPARSSTTGEQPPPTF